MKFIAMDFEPSEKEWRAANGIGRGAFGISLEVLSRILIQ